MKAKLLFCLLIWLVGLFPRLAPAQVSPLEAFQWERRILLLFADQPADPWAYQQRMELLEDRCDFNNRDLLLLEIYADLPVLVTGVWFGGEAIEETPLESISNADLRREYGFESGFGLVLVGKDGWEKRRSQLPDSVSQIYAQIDGMPMRQREMRDDNCAAKTQGS